MEGRNEPPDHRAHVPVLPIHVPTPTGDLPGARRDADDTRWPGRLLPVVRLVASFDPSPAASPGRSARRPRLLGADAPSPIAGALRGPGRPNFDALALAQLYLLDHEFAAEIDNRTMDGVIRLGWAKDETGRYSGRWPSS
jgi:hypothetical protein